MGGLVKQTVREWYQQNYDKYPEKEELIAECVRVLGVTRDQVVRKVKEIKLKTMRDSDSVPETVGLSEDELRSRCDIIYKIETAVKKIPSDKYIPDSEFREFFCQINANKYRSKADLPQFEKYKLIADGVIYWARPENIKRLKESGVFQ